MTSDELVGEVRATPGTRSTGRVVLGLVLLLPALLCCITELLFPTLRTFYLSLQGLEGIGGGGFVGLENYDFLFNNTGFGQALGFTLLFLVVRLLVVAIAPPLLAWSAARLGRPVRLILRVLLSLPIALFVPVAFGAAWMMALHPVTGLFPFDTPLFVNPATARGVLLFVDALYTFGLACGLGLILFLPIWRRPQDAPPPSFREIRKPLLTTWGIGLLAVAALTLSTFIVNYTMTGGGPRFGTMTIGSLLHHLAFIQLRVGPAAALASLILLITLALGGLAGLLVVSNRLRLSTVGGMTVPQQAEDEEPDRPRSRTVPLILLLLTLLPALGACFLGILPFGWLVPQALDGFGRLAEQIPVGRMLFNTFIPPFVVGILELLIVYLAALSIGALRPLGKRSDRLLLAFSPWLFITILPLGLANFTTLRNIELLNSFFALIPSILFSVPALFILTLFFKGRAARWEAATAGGEEADVGHFFRHIVLPSLPLLGVLMLFLLFIDWQRTLWPLLASVIPGYHTLGVAMLRLQALLGTGGEALAAGAILFLTLVSLFCFVGLVVFQLLYLDRLVLYAEDR